MDERAEKAEAVIAQMKAERGGSIYPQWEFAARLDPDFLEAYNRMYKLGLGDGSALSAKVREFVALGILCFKNAETSVLKAHMARAIRLGATKQELLEALEAAYVPGGAPTFYAGLTALLELEGETA